MTRPPNNGVNTQELLLEAMENVETYYEEGGPESATPPVSINWTELGPDNVGGRTRTILIDNADPTGQKIWAGGVSGGLWLSTNGGNSWQPVDDFFANLAVTTIAQHPTNSNILYFGTGEGWFNVDAVRGLGIWRSTDGGQNWSRMLNQLAPGNLPELETFSHIQKLVVDAGGHLYAGTRQNGLMRLEDGGSNLQKLWQRVTFTPAQCSANPLLATPTCNYNFVDDIEIASDGTIDAAFQDCSAPESFIIKSTNGTSWTCASSLPNYSDNRRLEIATGPPTAPGNPSVIYVLAGHYNDFVALACFVGISGQPAVDIYRSDDGGTTWSIKTLPTDINSCVVPDFTRLQSWYDLALAVSSTNPDHVYCGGINLFRSQNGGSNWQQISESTGLNGLSQVHVDQHVINIHKNNPNLLYVGNDGGVWQSTNATGTSPIFTSKNNGYNVTQLYSVGVHPMQWKMLAGAQDNGTQIYASSSMQSTSKVFGGDGGYCFIDQDDPDNQIVSAQFGNFHLSVNGGQTFNPIQNIISGSDQFIAAADYDDINDHLYMAHAPLDYIYYENVTGPPPPFYPVHHLPIAPTWGSDVVDITHIKVSPNNPDFVYFCTSMDINGTQKAYVVKADYSSGTPVYTNLSGSDFPLKGNISCIDVEDGDEDHLIISFYNYDLVSNVFESKDGGLNWQDSDNALTSNLDPIPVRWVMFAPHNPKYALLATEVGVWFTDNLDGSNTVWRPENLGLANVRVDMLRHRPHGNIIFAATHGRGLFSTAAFSQPAVDFLIESPSPCHLDMVDLTDNSILATSWAWDFDSDGVIDATTQHAQACDPGPTITLTINGDPTLTVSKPFAYNMNCQSNPCTGNGSSRLQADQDNFNPTISPNPFQQQTTIAFFNEEETEIEIRIIDLSGKEIHTIQKKAIIPPGTYRKFIKASVLPASGLYFISIQKNQLLTTHKIMYLP